MRLSVKLGAVCAVAGILPLAVASVVVLRNSPALDANTDSQILRTGARAAAGIYEKRLEQMRLTAQHLANEIGLRILSQSSTEAPRTQTLARLQDLLSGATDDLGLDFMVVCDPSGRIVAKHNGQPAPGESLVNPDYSSSLGRNLIAAGAQMRTSPIASCIVEPAQGLRKLWLEEAARVERTDGSVLTDALMIEAGAPIITTRGFLGAILIGQMLNTYYLAPPGAESLRVPLLAEIQLTLFGVGETDSGVLIALGDTIVASSIRDPQGKKPALLGFRRNPLRDTEEVWSEGRRYEITWNPIKSLDGTSPGALGVGKPGNIPPWTARYPARLLALIGAVGTLLSAAAGFFLGRRLASRLNSLNDAIGRMSVGELSTNLRDYYAINESGKDRSSRDEISRLAEQLDQMRESFRQAIERLRKR